jgi:ribosomal protein L37AE/L43A
MPDDYMTVKRIRVQGKEFHCEFCGHDEFVKFRHGLYECYKCKESYQAILDERDSV